MNRTKVNQPYDKAAGSAFVEIENLNQENENNNKENKNQNKSLQSTTLTETGYETLTNTNELIEGKNRIVAATEKEKQAHNKMDESDSMAVRQTNLMTVIANHTLVTLQTETNTTPLMSAPLSSFVFGKADRSVKSAYGISPYIITTEVPHLFKFKPMYNELQQVNLPDLLTVKFSSQDVVDVVAESIRIFNISTMTVRVELNDKIGAYSIIDPNNFQDGVLRLQSFLPSGRENPQTSLNFVENRIFSIIGAFLALDNLLVAIPKKIVMLESIRGGPVAESLVSMPFYQGMHPHPYLSVFSNIPDWARQHFNQAFQENPLQLGDLAVNSYAGMKLAQMTKLITDQYSAAFLRLNFQKLRNHTLTTNVLQEKIRASLFKHDKLEVQELCDLEDFTLLYNYTQDEHNLYMFRVLTDRQTQLKIVNFLNEELVKTNRLTTVPLDDVWRGLIAGEVQAANFNQTWLSSINVGNQNTPYEMLIYETFSDFFTFNLNFSATPNSIEAISEILSIHVFMILYPRITQRTIHNIGYRLTSLYSVMFSSVFTSFREKYGDVRTDWGKNKLAATGHQITRAESQQGYIYSIFSSLDKDKPTGNDARNPESDINVLNNFVNLLESLRLQVLPTTHQYSLDRKRIAKYPFMYDNYTAYASWEPISYQDYQMSQVTGLGVKLQRLMKKANEFKDLFTKQNPASAELPRGFNTYFITWTNQLTRILSTVGPTYQITSAMMQETLFNSPFYVGSQYTPDPSKFWYVPRDIAIGPLVSASKTSLIIPTHTVVSSFKINVGMCLAMSIEGEYLRDLFSAFEGQHDVQQSRNRIRSDITALDAVECFKMTNSLMSDARKFGFAMQVTQWLTTPNDENNPFGGLVSEIAKYMKMASWVPLIKKVFSIFELSFDDTFVRTMGESAFVIDGRYLDRTLVIVNPSTSMAIEQQPLASKFGMKFNYMVPLDIDKLNILTKPLLSLDSKIIYIHKDWYFGKLIVDEMGPTQTALSTTNWSDSTTYNQYFKFSRVNYKNGQAAQLSYKSDIDGSLKSIILPYTASSVPILLINVEYATELDLLYLRVLSQAIAHGKIVMHIKFMKIRVWIDDMPLRTQDYSEPMMTEDEVYDILSLPAGCIIERRFKTTKYASNFSSQALVCPGYIQWFATPSPADRNIFASTITNAIIQPSQTILPSSDEMGYGPDEEGMTFPNHTLKTESNKINWNNSIPTVSTKLINTVSIKLIPYIPQYLGNS